MLRRPRTPSLLAVPVLAAGLALATAPAASAHAQFVGADPAEGSTVDALPAVVVMTYDEDISPQFVDTAVVPPGGDPVVVEATVDGVDVAVPVADDPALAALATDPAAAGEWQVVARVVSVDGHPVEHTTEFVLPGTAVAAPPAAEVTAAEPTATTEAPGPSAPVASPAAEAPTAEPQDGPSDPGGSEAAAAVTTAATEPLAGTEGALPRWAVALTGLALLGAGATAAALAWRRRSAGGGPEQG